MANKNNDLQYISDEDEENRHLKLNVEVINPNMDLITELLLKLLHLTLFFFYCRMKYRI